MTSFRLLAAAGLGAAWLLSVANVAAQPIEIPCEIPPTLASHLLKQLPGASVDSNENVSWQWPLNDSSVTGVLAGIEGAVVEVNGRTVTVSGECIRGQATALLGDDGNYHTYSQEWSATLVGHALLSAAMAPSGDATVTVSHSQPQGYSITIAIDAPDI